MAAITKINPVIPYIHRLFVRPKCFTIGVAFSVLKNQSQLKNEADMAVIPVMRKSVCNI